MGWSHGHFRFFCRCNLTYSVKVPRKMSRPTLFRGRNAATAADPVTGETFFTRTKVLLNDISGEARDGEIMAVMGASGSGKSTLIDALANCMAKESLQKVQKSLLQSDVQSKSDKSPVTVADYGSQALVSFILEKEFPSMPFLLVAEEDSEDLRKEETRETLVRIKELVNDTLAGNGMNYISLLSEEDVLDAIDCGKSEGGPHGQHWVLDPIDGTRGFMRGDQYAIALALLDEGKVVLGVLACPNLPLTSLTSHDRHISEDKVGCLYFAQVGAGTYMQSLDGSPPTKVHVSATANPEEASIFESFEGPRSSHDLSSLIAKKMGVKAPHVRIDSQAKYGALSRGDGEIYLRFPREGYREKIWDHAAGYIVVAEAGGVVTDAAGNPLDFSSGKYLDLDTGIIVTNQKLMPALSKAVLESLKERASSL